MKKTLKVLGLGIFVLAVVFSFTFGQANAALTMAALTITSSGALTLDGAAASAITVGSATTTGNMAIGGALTTGTLTLGKSDATGAVVVYGGTTAANTLFNNVTTGSIALGAALSTGNLTLGGAQTSGAITIGGGVQTGTITLGGGTGAQIVNVGTGATGVKTINIGTSAVANVLTIGTTNGAASLDLMSGTGGVNLTGHVATKGAVPTFTQSAGTPTYLPTSTDTAGWVKSDTTSHTTVVVTFAAAYAIAPHCTFSPDNAAAAVLVGSGTGVFGVTTTTALTITHAADTTEAAWNYICVEGK